MGLEELPQAIAQNVQDAIDQSEAEVIKDLRQDEIDVEKLRIKTEERIAERQAERDEKVAEITSNVEEYRSLLDSLFMQFNDLINTLKTPNSVPPNVDVDIETAHEDEPSNESETETDEFDEPEELVEELGSESESIVNSVNPVEENNGSEKEIGDSRRRKRKRARR